MKAPPNTTLFIAGLSPDTNAMDLGKWFESFGELVRCDITKSKSTNSTIAFVEFVDLIDAERAWSTLDGESFKGRRLHIDYATRSPSASWDLSSTFPRGNHHQPSAGNRRETERDYYDYDNGRGRGRDRYRDRDRDRSLSPHYSHSASRRYHHSSSGRDYRQPGDSYRSSYRSRSRSHTPPARRERDRASTPDYHSSRKSRDSRRRERSRTRSRSPPPPYHQRERDNDKARGREREYLRESDSGRNSGRERDREMGRNEREGINTGRVDHTGEEKEARDSVDWEKARSRISTAVDGADAGSKSTW